jgi:hypothetical protein
MKYWGNFCTKELLQESKKCFFFAQNSKRGGIAAYRGIHGLSIRLTIEQNPWSK